MFKGLTLVILPLFFALAPLPVSSATDTGGGSGTTPQYLNLHPAFTVNLADTERSRFMRVETEIMSRDPGRLETAKAHMPALRHELILLFSEQTLDAVRSIAGKERMRREALDAINAALKEETGETPVEAVYFTSLIVQ